MLRKLVIWLLLIPLPLNGLWLMCRDAAPESQMPVGSSASDETNLFESVAAADASSQSGADCRYECVRKGRSNDGSFCLVSGGSKTSLMILVFGVAVLPPQVPLQTLAVASQLVPELPDFYLNPIMDRSTPPPRV